MTGASLQRPAAGGAQRIVLADADDAHELTGLITSAIFGIAPCVWLFPDPVERARLLPRLIRLHLDVALEYGAVYTTEDKCTAAVWLPRDEDYCPPQDEEARLIDAVGRRHVKRVQRYDAIAQSVHPAAAHDCLWAVAVHPDQQRAGLGSAMLDEHHRLLDTRGRAAYVEASDAGTRSLYLRLGYRDLPAPHIVLPAPERCVLYGMWRPPRSIETHLPAWASLDKRVRVRAQVSDWGGSLGTVVAVKPENSGRPISVVLDEDNGPEPDPRDFAVAELEPADADTGPGAGVAGESDVP